ncbi:tyrosine-protein phosphatase non-receptor type 13-like [Arapaima gigas]
MQKNPDPGRQLRVRRATHRLGARVLETFKVLQGAKRHHQLNVSRMSNTFVTLAEVLEMRGGPLEEDEIWSLLMGSAESLVDLSSKGKHIQLYQS